MIAFAELIQTISACKEAIPLDGRIIAPELRLIPYYPDYATTLPWYQDLSLCVDVCLQPSGEINIVIAKPFQNKHIGSRVPTAPVQRRGGKQYPCPPPV